MRLAVLHTDSRTAEAHTSLAGLALIRFNGKGLFVLDVLKENAGTAGDDDRGLLDCKLLHNSRFAFLKVIGVYNSHAVYSESVAKRLEIHLRGGIALYVISRGGIYIIPETVRSQ